MVSGPFEVLDAVFNFKAADAVIAARRLQGRHGPAVHALHGLHRVQAAGTASGAMTAGISAISPPTVQPLAESGLAHPLHRRVAMARTILGTKRGCVDSPIRRPGNGRASTTGRGSAR